MIETREMIRKNMENELQEASDIAIYGAGNVGKDLLEVLHKKGYSVINFIDKKSKDNAQEYCGLQVMSPNLAKCKLPCNTLIVVAMYDVAEAAAVIAEWNHSGFHHVFHFSTLRDCLDFSTSSIFSTIGFDFEIKENLENIQETLNLLADDESRKVFLEVIKFAFLTPDFPCTLLPAKAQYFAYDIYKRKNDEVFVDCGGFIGDTMEIFIENSNGCFSEYIVFEPDENNLSAIELLRAGYQEKIAEKIKIMPYAVSNQAADLRFMGRGTSNSRVSVEGDISINAVTLDEKLSETAVSFIKMDVEGYEIKALQGAKAIITKNKPVLAICAYHKITDLWEIPKLIRALNPEYSLYLRNYNGLIEYVYYAVPKTRQIISNINSIG